EYTTQKAPLTGALFLPALAPDELTGSLTGADQEVVERLIDLELTGAVALARTLSRDWKRHDQLLQAPRFAFVSNATDGKG
ncbi:hypothetical protein ABTH20_21290, partial [Acinetobacter baumannii]